MAQYLDKKGLTTLWNKIKNTFALKSHTHKKSEITDLTIPTVNNPTITINQGGTKKGSFTLNQSGNTTIDLTDNNTTYTAGTGLSLSSGVFSVKTGYTTSGKNYKVSADSSGNLYVSVPWNNDTWRPVVDNLTTTDATKSLSANQGKVLKDLVDGKAASSHTHNYLPLTGGTMTGSISYKGTKNTYEMIKWIDNTADAYGNGIRIGGGGATIIGGGESASQANVSGGDEVLYLMNDAGIDFYSNCQDGLSSAKHMTFDTSGNLNIPTNVVGSSSSNRLIFRHLDGQNCNGDYNLYLQYHQQNSRIYLNGSTYYIENGYYYNGIAAQSNLINPSQNVTSTGASTWDPTNSGKIIWGQKFANSAISNDTGDLTLFLRPSVYTSGATELCMNIDGDYYSMGTKLSRDGHTHSKSEVGLGNVDNTADANKNVNYATSAGNADTLDGNHASAFAKIASHNNLMSSGDEFTFASSGFSGAAWINYRTAGGTNGNITEYKLGNGAGGLLGTIIHSGNIGSQNVNYANSAGSAKASNISMSFSNGVLTITYNS